MTDLQKKLLYDKYLRGDVLLEDMFSAELKALKVLWVDEKMKSVPTPKHWDEFDNELRRREIQGATKPLPIDHDFYKDK